MGRGDRRDVPRFLATKMTFSENQGASRLSLGLRYSLTGLVILNDCGRTNDFSGASRH